MASKTLLLQPLSLLEVSVSPLGDFVVPVSSVTEGFPEIKHDLIPDPCDASVSSFEASKVQLSAEALAGTITVCDSYSPKSSASIQP